MRVTKSPPAATRASSLSLVRYKDNDYSAPTRYCHQNVLAMGYVDRVEIVRRGETFAVHARNYDKLYNRFTDPKRFRPSVAHNLELSSVTNGNSVLVLLRLFLICGAPEAASTRCYQFTRAQFWPPQMRPPNAQPSTRSVCGLFMEILAV